MRVLIVGKGEKNGQVRLRPKIRNCRACADLSLNFGCYHILISLQTT